MEKDLDYYKNNAEEDYMNTPISVLRYITELEEYANQFKKEADVIKSVCDVHEDTLIVDGKCSRCEESFDMI